MALTSTIQLCQFYCATLIFNEHALHCALYVMQWSRKRTHPKPYKFRFPHSKKQFLGSCFPASLSIRRKAPLNSKKREVKQKVSNVEGTGIFLSNRAGPRICKPDDAVDFIIESRKPEEIYVESDVSGIRR